MLSSMSNNARTPAQIETSRRNGRLSAGPVSPIGKIRISTNGVVHGLRSERVVLAHEDPAAYLERVQVWVDSLKPADDAELEVVVSIADVRWRIDRLGQVERNRLRAEALAQAEELPEVQHLRQVEVAATAAVTMAEVVTNPNLRTDEDITALLQAVRTVAGMVRAVEAEVPHLFLGADQLVQAAAMVAVISTGKVDADGLADLVTAARSTAAALGAELTRAREAATAATEALAAVVTLPDGKEIQLLARYRRSLSQQLESELRVLAAVRERRVQVTGTSGSLGQPIPVRLVG